MLLTYFLNDFEIVPVAPIITGITPVFTFTYKKESEIWNTCDKYITAEVFIQNSGQKT